VFARSAGECRWTEFRRRNMNGAANKKKWAAPEFCAAPRFAPR
jgi:hypothetical protein